MNRRLGCIFIYEKSKGVSDSLTEKNICEMSMIKQLAVAYEKESSVDVTCRSEPFSLLHFVRLDFGKMILDQLYKSTYLLDTGVHVYSDSRTNPVSRDRHNNLS